MTRAACAATAFVLAASAPLAGQNQQRPAFRATLDVVTVDVSVRTGATPVGGLTASDFVLRDNGVRQTIESVEMAQVPVDVSVLIDANEDVTIGLETIHDDIRKIAAVLRPDDRLRVMSINDRVRDTIRARAVPAFPALAAITPQGLSSANDGIAAALLRSAGGGRRHVVIAVTNGIDAVSTVSAAQVLALAKQSPAILHIVQLDMTPVGDPPDVRWVTGRSRLDVARAALTGLKPPTRLFHRPYNDLREEEILRAAAEATGGALHRPGLLRGASVSLIRTLLEDYRRSYLLRYTPSGVAREGWHTLAVTIPAHPSYTVHARRGYGIDAAGAQAAQASEMPEPEMSRVPGALDALVDAYNRGHYERFEQVLARASAAVVIASLGARGNPWPANPNREAAFVVEVSDAAIRSRRPGSFEAARDLLRHHRTLVRHPLGPDAFEKYWLWSLLAALQGGGQPQLTREFADHALARFPDEPRFLLARALAADQARAFAPAQGRDGAGQDAHVREVTSRYDAAARFEDTAAEARVRKAYFLHRIGRHAEALAELDMVTATQTGADAAVAYFHLLFRGRVLEALDRHGEARAAYEQAGARQPGAQSPKVALMRLLLRAGDRPAAQTLAAGIASAPEDAFDPWWAYWLGDARHYPAIVATLRERTR